MSIQIEPFDRQKHSRANFSCGRPSLDRYIAEQLSQDVKKGVAAAFVLTLDGDSSILGYYTLSASIVDIAALDSAIAKKLPRYPQLPATLLGRLAVDEKSKGQHFGEMLLVDALRRSSEATKQIASVAVVAEALDENAVNFYRRYGFQPFRDDVMKLYYPMQSIEALCKKLGL
jgi:predicted GNAT family N-acyltransferase